MEDRNKIADVIRTFAEHKFALPVVIGFSVLFYIMTLRVGHAWGGDFSQYIHHAKNLAEGKSYFSTHYIVNAFGFVGPYAYPPVFPLLLVPILMIWGVNLFLLKLVVIGCFSGMLVSISILFRDRLSKPMMLLLLLFIGFNPGIWEYRDSILSEFSFMLFSFIGLFLIQHNVTQLSVNQVFSQRILWLSILLGFVMYLSYGVREMGVLLPIALVTFDVLKTKRISLASITALLVFAFLFFMQYQFFHNPPYADPELMEKLFNLERGDVSGANVSHFKYFNFDISSVITQAYRYTLAIKQIFPSSDYQVLRFVSWPLFFGLGVFALFGFVVALKNISVLEVYVAGYLTVVLLFGGFAGLRYVLPIIPFLFYYAFIGGSEIRRLGFNKCYKGCLFIFVVSGVLLYSVSILSMKNQVIKAGVTAPFTVEMFDFVKNQTKEDDMFVFPKPRVLALFTDRNTASYSDSITDKFYLCFLDTLGADYIIDAQISDGEVLSHRKQDSSFYSENEKMFKSVFQNKYFTIYKYNPVLKKTNSCLQKTM